MIRKIGIALALTATLLLGGCQTATTIGTIGTILAGQTANPVTPRAVATLHSAFIIGVAIPAGRYASLPRCSKHAPPCSSQKVVNGMRKYINPAAAALDRLDDWVAGNRKLDAPALFQAARDLIQGAKDFGKANGVPGIQ